MLTAMGYPPAEARGSLRLSPGRTTSDEDVDALVYALPPIIDRLRAGADRLDEGGAGVSAA